jgi:DNA-binding MurR/RpiR family transcriptional regulator
LGTIVGVSESTVVRFANELGYEGYPELQRALRKLIRNRLTSFQRVEVTNSLIGEDDVLERVLASDIEKIRQTATEIDHESFSLAVKNIVNAKNIYIIGVRSSSTLAGFLNYSLRMIFDNVRFVQTTSGSEMFEQIMQIGEGDVMIAISFPRYSSRIINAVEYAKGRGADVVALTDSNLSPIAAKADQLLIAHSDMASFVDSLVAPLSIINALVVAVAREREAEVSERLRVLEEVWDRYDVYDKKRN